MATCKFSTVVDTTRNPSYFSYLPVRIHEDIRAVETATFDAINTCAPPDSKERSQAVYRHTNLYGNPYALCHPECDTKKLEYIAKVVELIWIDDDVTEELPHAEALREHEILRQGLHAEFDNNVDTGKSGVRKGYMRALREEMLALDPIDTPAVLETLDRYLREYDDSEIDFTTIEEYLPYRIPHAGYRVCSHLTRWAMNIHLTEEETQAIHAFEWTLGGIVGLANDYFSWRKEKHQATDRVRNAVPILMRQYSLNESQAKLLLKGIIVEEEEKTKTLRLELEERENLSSDLKKYIVGLELYCGGNTYWSATCPRYNKPQEEKTELPTLLTANRTIGSHSQN